MSKADEMTASCVAPMRELKKNRLRVPMKRRGSEQSSKQEAHAHTTRCCYPHALGTIEEDLEYEEGIQCSRPSGRDDAAPTKAQELENRNSELEARVAELERKLLVLSAGQEVQQ